MKTREMRDIFPDGVNNALEIVGAKTVKDTMKCVTHWGSVVVIGLLGGAPILENFNLMGDRPRWRDIRVSVTALVPSS